MSDFEQAVNYVLKNEKGISNHVNDKGGYTNFGISLRFLKSISPVNLRYYGIFEEPNEQTIHDLTIDKVKKIYHNEFWVNAPFDRIGHQEIANYIFDMAVNLGVAPAIKCIQRAVWSVMRKCSLIDDGIMGEKTLAAIGVCGFMLLPAMRSERAGYYRLVAKELDDRTFLEGWLSRAYETN